MSNTVALEFAGDASRLQAAARDAEQATTRVGDAANQASTEMAEAAQGSNAYADRMAKLGSAVDGASTAIGDAAGTMQALADIQDYSRAHAMRLARAQADVEQAMLDQKQAAVDLEQAVVDLNQAHLDGRQAGLDQEQALIDQKQAMLDAEAAQQAYNDAVAEHGAGSAEARQAAIDLTQAQQDLKQANLDAEQAQADAAQAQTDAKQATVDQAQAVRDGKDAQLDLNDAMHEANPPQLQQWAEMLNLVAPLLTGLVGIVALVTAAQWAWNAAQAASPLTWIIIGIVALVAVIVLIATQTTWFQDLWRAAWGWIKDAAAAVGDWFTNTLWPGIQAVWQGIVDGVMWVKNKFAEGFTAARDAAARAVDGIVSIPGRIGSAFSRLADIITSPFRAAFRAVASAWNNTVGALSWTVPDWVPGIGGAHISAPRLPVYHRGGIVPGSLGAETLAVLQAGERIIPNGGGGGAVVLELRSSGSRVDDLLVEILSEAIRARGGDVQVVLGSA